MFASLKTSKTKTKNRKIEPIPSETESSSSSDNEDCEVIYIIAPTDLDNETTIKEEPQTTDLEFTNHGVATDVDIGCDFTPSTLSTPFTYTLNNSRSKYRRAEEILEVVDREFNLISATYLDENTGELALLKFMDDIQTNQQ